jgi:thiamine pyrophosphokinase
MGRFTLVVGNGEWTHNELIETLLEKANFTIALDGAADRFDSWDIVVGDMDSISKPVIENKDGNKDNSDLAKALINYDVDAVIGVDGGRLDHRLAAFTSLFETGSDAILYFDGWRACRVDESGLEIELQPGNICSLMAFGKVNNVTITGVEFELDSVDLFTGTKGVGNKTTSSEISISHEGGNLLFIWEANEL